MTLTNKAIWTIERNLHRELTLSALAEACGVSAYHLAHTFGEAAGLSVMHYVRGRRLSEAAEALASGAARDILNLALEAGYGSHEAFSRAFRAQFGTTPEAVRAKKTTEDLAMIKPMKVPNSEAIPLSPPRIVSGELLLAVGFTERQSFASTQNIPGQWQRFMARYHEIEDKVNEPPLGISANMDADGNFEYSCAAEVSKISNVPEGMKPLRIPAQRYAVFLHSGHVSKIGNTYNAIWNTYQDHPPADGPVLERHLKTFDPQTGLGGVEIWIPIDEAA